MLGLQDMIIVDRKMGWNGEDLSVLYALVFVEHKQMKAVCATSRRILRRPEVLEFVVLHEIKQRWF